MKLADYALLFLCVLIPVVAVIDVGLLKKDDTLQYRTDTEKALSCGVHSAVCSFDVSEGEYEVHHNPEEVVNDLFSGIASVMGRLDDPEGMEDIKGRIPVICIMYEDGFFLRYMMDKVDPKTGYTVRTYEYTELKPYYFREDEYIYVVKNGEQVIEYDITSGNSAIIPVTGTELEKKINEKKTQLVNSALEEYCSEYGLFGSSGESFPEVGFGFTAEETSEYERAMPGKGIIVVFHDEYIPYIISAAGIS